MATVVSNAATFEDGQVAISISRDSVTGNYVGLSWTLLAPGTLTVLIQQAGKADITRSVSASGSVAITKSLAYADTAAVVSCSWSPA